jgi:hypothetical protein
MNFAVVPALLGSEGSRAQLRIHRRGLVGGGNTDDVGQGLLNKHSSIHLSFSVFFLSNNNYCSTNNTSDHVLPNSLCGALTPMTAMGESI